MPFDPNGPTFKAANTSAKMREQLTGLQDLIDTGGAHALRQPDPPAVDYADHWNLI
jgi:hypothetical protein